MSGSLRARIFFISLFFVLLLACAWGRLFYLQVLKGDYYESAARNQQSVLSTVPPERGDIYLNSLAGSGSASVVPLALTRTWYNVWVAPKDIPIDRRAEIAQKLSEFLKLDKTLVEERLAKENDPYEPLKDKVDKEDILELEKLKYPGVFWKTAQDRYYPLGEFASQVVGFVSLTPLDDASPQGGTKDSEIKMGQSGLERFFDKTLRGETGYIAGFKKALGSLILPLSRVIKPKNGRDVYLTIDYNIQMTLERELKKAAEKYSAAGASGVVMDPKTGAILAMAAWPSFDPNKYNEVKDASVFLNPVTQLVFEPGSIFKPVTMATALDINVVSPDLTYFDTGEVTIGADTIRNSTLKSWGQQNMTQVLEKSLNTGAIFVVRRMPQGVWREYVDNFGFSEKTGITLSGEAKGDISNLKSGVELDWVTSSFGQGISVTPLAMIDAIAAIANGGELLKPYLVSKIVDNDEVVFTGERVVKRRVIKPSTGETLTKMLINVVKNGSGRQASIPGYSVAGKTGTAQVAGSQGGYTEKTIHTFVGYSPAFNPAFVMLVKLDDPKGIQFSEGSVAPLFRSVGEFILHYMDVPPDQPLNK